MFLIAALLLVYWWNNPVAVVSSESPGVIDKVYLARSGEVVQAKAHIYYKMSIVFPIQKAKN